MIKTAIYHFEAKVISRGAGRSAVAAAAYQSGEQLYNDYDGITHDYTKKTGVLFSEILLPDMAPAEWADRQTLWNAVEQAEKAKDSRLARQLIVALPTELTMQDWQAMLHQFVLEECVAKGMCADFAIHDTDGHNPHAHIMLTVRPLDANGKWQAKTQKEYLCRRGEEKGFTAAEFRQAQSEGWEKLYKYRNESGVTGWFTPSEAALHPTWERTSKQPKATKFGRQNPICEAWNSEVQLLEWRERWAEYINRALEQQQRSERVTHLSHAALGLSEQPTVHEGYHARNLEKQGNGSVLFLLPRSINQCGHDLLAGVALGKSSALLLLTAEIAQIRLIDSAGVKLNADAMQPPDKLRRCMGQIPDCVFVRKAAGSMDCICVMLFRTVILAFGVQGSIDATLCHDGLRPFGGIGGHQYDFVAVFRGLQGCGKPRKTSADNNDFLFHSCCHPT